MLPEAVKVYTLYPVGFVIVGEPVVDVAAGYVFE